MRIVPFSTTLRLAAAKKDGRGWAVNHGDIWLAESAARLVRGAELAAGGAAKPGDAAHWTAEAARLLERSAARTEDAGVFGPGGHPWACEIRAALATYHSLQESGIDVSDWLDAFKLRTAYWCAQALGGAPPFPPKPRPRREEAAALVRRLPGHKL